jgi:hypothetical protein
MGCRNSALTLFGKMKFFYRITVIATCLSSLLWLVVGNTALALKARIGEAGMRDVVLLEIPFANKTYRLPDWMWGLYPWSVVLMLTLASGVLWTVFLVNRRRMRQR